MPRVHCSCTVVRTALVAALCLLTPWARSAELAGVSVGVSGWTIVVLRDAEATTHLIAARDDDKARGTDIDVVLYIRTAEGWDAEAYDPATGKEDALIALATEFGLPDPMSGDWGVEGLDPQSVTGFAGPRMAFKTGFFEADPLSEAAAAMSNPEPLVQTAEGLGLAAGSSVVNTGSVGGIEPQPVPEECGCAAGLCIQDAIAAGVDALIADPELEFEAVEGIAYQEWTGGNAFFFCCPWEWTQWEGPWSDWDCSSPMVYERSELLPYGLKECFYTATVERRKQRIRIKRCLNCMVYSRRQTLTETCTFTSSIIVPDANDCPESPSAPTPCDCPSGGSTQTSDWTPPLPGC